MAQYNTLLSVRSLHIVHTESSRGWGGQEIRILEESRGLIERGHHVTLLCPADSTIFVRAKDWGVKAVAVPIREKRWADFKALRAWIRENRHEIDVVNTHSSTDSWLMALVNLTLRKNALPIVRTRHISAPVKRSWYNRWLYAKAAKRVITTGEELRRELIDSLGLPAEHVQSVFTGINTKRFQPGDKVAAREKLGLDTNAVWIGIVATLRSWKGHRYLMKAIAELNDPRIRLAIVGDGPQREKLNRLAVELGLARSIRFAGQQRDVLPWLQALDIFVLPSYANEGVSQAVMQAMAVGLPVITTPIGSSADVVRPGMTGLVVPPKDIQALGGAIRQLLDKPGEADRLGNAAHNFALEHCGIERMLTRMEAVFQRAAS
ncbi:MAG: glycosyl transferase family 1 [Candidatus Dactylopiibacterium carminicum]|uniref:Glycosyl transferase family 1 n=1 Tax=Candidatus Dactylopiibacterium carminicum TaxID=857335 RepID=A0A272EN02_9RHOO|nr:glycosyltransferase family 4 protein [Candidatus Dactylopiibacterium carminicum]KAF7597916.1 glycosyltransferase family 1 protein [Candidatus Dactylopiibacterium carminicum]PAS91495.1 MAG: glycosyl transferase family 1 [Candidatus Dactylopiibacterium carminicum]PAS95981.1 MAG: glycosyl transferase family 1 [Candidatus Dactylopiibacterium carminicum]